MDKILGLKQRTKRRASVTLVGFVLFVAILLINILRLDLFGYERYKDKAFDQITTTSSLSAERGIIYDSNMNVLATTRSTWRISVSPKTIKTVSDEVGRDFYEIIADGLSRILSLDKASIKTKISNSAVLDVTLDRAANEDEYREILNFIEENDIESLIQLEEQTARYYPEGTLAAHVLGFTGSDNQGLFGLEYYYDDILSGTDGYYLYAKDANGRPMPNEYTDIVEAIDGYSLITTIDSYIQEALEAELSRIVTTHNVTNRATGIVMDTKTGAILAMATSSPFDPNSPFELDELSNKKLGDSGFKEGSEEYKKLKNELMQIMWSNKAVSETYEPGSTFKIVTVAAALDSGAAKLSDTFSCPGYHTVGGWRIKCHKTTGHGTGFSLSYGLQMSCNPTMMTVAERMGKETFYNYVDKFGYFEKTGIDLPSEASTIFHKLDNIGSTELATASFGQRFKVSIISQLTAVAAVANGGYLVEPYVVDKVVDSQGNIIKEHGTVKRGQVISSEVASKLAEVLEEGVSGEGGAKNAYVEGYEVAAKTGTSQKFDILDENGNSYLRIGSTVAFSPIDDSGVAVIIVVDEPQSQVKYGSTVAAPYISSLLTKVLPYLEYEPSTKISTYTTENYRGMNISSAKSLLTEKGIKYEVIGSGSIVTSQLPEKNIDITPGLSTVYLYTENLEAEYINVPSLVGLSALEANKLAINAGLNIRIIGINDPTSSQLTVVEQSFEPGSRVRRGEVITIKLYQTDFED